MLKSFIRSLTSFINTNRQDIKTTLKYSSILTAGIMAMFAYHPALMSVWAYIGAGLDTMLLGFTFAAETVSNFIHEAAAGLWVGLATVAVEWATAFIQFISLPIVEMANVSIANIGYAGTLILVFIITSITVYIIRKAIIDTVRFYKDDDYKLDEMPIISAHVTYFSFLIFLIPMMIIDFRRGKNKTSMQQMHLNEAREIIKGYNKKNG